MLRLKGEIIVARYPSQERKDEYNHEVHNIIEKQNNEYGTDYDSGVYSTLVASVKNKDVHVFIRMNEDSASDSVPDFSGNSNILNATQVRNTF